MGLLDDINTSTGEGFGKNYVPEGQHELRVTKIVEKKGTAKNAGKEWTIFSGEFIKSSRTDLPSCNAGMPFSIFVQTNQYPQMAADKLKNFMLATASQEDLAGFPRNRLAPDCVQQQNNPYANATVGITWAEYFAMCIRHNAADGVVVQVTATNIDRREKGKSPVTNYDFVAKGKPRLEIRPAPIVAPVQQAQQPAPSPTVAPTPAFAPTQQANPLPGAAPVGGRLF